MPAGNLFIYMNNLEFKEMMARPKGNGPTIPCALILLQYSASRFNRA
jgi:hypothetical protein